MSEYHDKFEIPIRFKVLQEEVSDNDGYQKCDDNVSSHKKLAKELVDVVSSNSSITIGLEGSWGSGKSTLVNIFKNKLEQTSEKNKVFIFDAWAHESDVLRSVFLENLILFLDGDKKLEKLLSDGKLEELSKSEEGKLLLKITGYLQETTTTTKKKITLFGKLLGIFTLLIPLGSLLFTSYGGDKGCWFLGFIGFMILIIPPLLAFFSIFCKNLSLTEDANKSEEIKTFSEDNYRSSAEFERYFFKTLDIYKEKFDKLIIVIDNIDRVEEETAKNIWATLQTFLQFRSNNNKKDKLLNNVHWIIPYESCNLNKLWDKNEVDNNKISNHFLDKIFQLRIEVSKINITDWKKFAEQQIEASITETDKNRFQDYKNVLIDVLTQTRANVADSPTPREIKTYINQVNFLRKSCHPTVSTEAIAYYAARRYLKPCKNIEEIKDGLLENKTPEKHSPTHEFIQDDNMEIKKHIAAIIFNDSVEKAYHILLEPIIEDIVQQENSEQLKEHSINLEGLFWDCFSKYLDKKIGAK